MYVVLRNGLNYQYSIYNYTQNLEIYKNVSFHNYNINNLTFSGINAFSYDTVKVVLFRR